MYPEELKYTKDHEWISKDGTVGVTDHAQHELGDVVFVELPKKDASLKRGSEMCVLESVKAVSNVYCPVSGTVISVNEDLVRTPELINSDPYGKGWIAKISISDINELDSLMGSKAYQDLVGSK